MLVDYSLYLVTDSTPEILGDRRLTDVVEAAIKGGTSSWMPAAGSLSRLTFNF
jgi:hypothetical protein